VNDALQQTTERLLRQYHGTRDERARDRIVQRYMPLARNLARQYHQPPVALEDLVQVASLGLIEAVERFDPTRGVPFGAFARPTIAGELRRYLRDTTWAVHVPRSVKEAMLALARAERELTRRLRRTPDVAELAAATGLTEAEVREAQRARRAQVIAWLDAPAASGGEAGDPFALTVADTVGAQDERIVAAEQRATVAPLLRSLTERERAVLLMRYGRELTQSEIADRVGCSQPQVSRILTGTIKRLRELAHTQTAQGMGRTG
jgi:RNA polymerase sigma-B factor